MAGSAWAASVSTPRAPDNPSSCKPNAIAWRSTFCSNRAIECDRLEIHFLQQPGGGRLALYDYDEFLDEIPTEGEPAAGFVRYETQPGPHRFLLKTLDARPVRLFGWVADKAAGVTYEALGINGAEATLLLKWDETMLAAYLQRRNPAMIVLSYGTNEASDPLWHRESYRDAFAKVVDRSEEHTSELQSPCNLVCRLLLE